MARRTTRPSRRTNRRSRAKSTALAIGGGWLRAATAGLSAHPAPVLPPLAYRATSALSSPNAPPRALLSASNDGCDSNCDGFLSASGCDESCDSSCDYGCNSGCSTCSYGKYRTASTSLVAPRTVTEPPNQPTPERRAAAPAPQVFAPPRVITHQPNGARRHGDARLQFWRHYHVGHVREYLLQRGRSVHCIRQLCSIAQLPLRIRQSRARSRPRAGLLVSS